MKALGILQSPGKFATVDDRFYPVLSKITWSLTNKGHAVGRWRGRKWTLQQLVWYLHTGVISGPGTVVHHINFDEDDPLLKLNCTVDNLQLLTKREHIALHKAARQAERDAKKQRSRDLLGKILSNARERRRQN
jgi:HNH endonuclease